VVGSASGMETSLFLDGLDGLAGGGTDGIYRQSFYVALVMRGKTRPLKSFFSLSL
jgi:hypothetical protein